MDRAARRYTAPFFAAYFFYYAGYCVFSSFLVPYLTHRGCSATLCGVIGSLTLFASLLMEPVGGYLTDTVLPARRYLPLCIGAITALCAACTLFSERTGFCVAVLVLSAGLAYPFSQLLDAWVNCSRDLDGELIYSRVRAGGSIGFAAVSVAAGYFFRRFGWGSYFLLQASMFLLMLPFLRALPEIPLGNREKEARGLSPADALRVLLGSGRYLFCLLICTMYWFSHRPVGSFLSLIVSVRAGDESVYGNVCGVGAAVECLSLLLLAEVQKRRRVSVRTCMLLALLTNLLRPMCIFLLPGWGPLYLGQVFQSVSFALFYSGSVECFTLAADRRIRSFCISVGLTVSSAAGTVGANLLGGRLCDRLGAGSLAGLSLALSAGNLLLFLAGRRLMAWEPDRRG